VYRTELFRQAHPGGDHMENLNLLLTFKMAGSRNVRFTGAARIKIDGCGGLVVYGARSEASERLTLDQLQLLSIQPLGVPSQLPAGYVC
jgi:hypothetical protein